MSRAWAPVALVAALGCAPTPVEVNLSFPSRETFLYSDFGRLRVYEVDVTMSQADCPVLLDRLAAGSMGTPVLDSDWKPICEFRAGAVTFPDAPGGPHAYLVQARSDENTVLLEGCRVGEAYVDAPAIEVQMFPTTDYRTATQGVSLSCSTEEDKCRDGC